jgi:hypothetical protein
MTLLGDGVFAAGDDGFTFPVIAGQGVNYGSVQTGNDQAIAAGFKCGFPWCCDNPTATNTVEITKNQNANGARPTLNIERVTVGDHQAMAIGSGAAANTVKIISNQQ